MNKSENYRSLKKFCAGLGIDLFGVADITQIREDFILSKNLLGKFDKAISLGVRLSGAILEDISGAPTRLYFHHYRSVNTFLDQAALRVYNYIQKKRYLALPMPASQILDWQKQTAHLSHKKIGYLAGLGWMGRNNLLVNKIFGSQIRLVSVLTNMPLALDTPVKDNCGDCSLCIEACPCGAIKEDLLEFDHIRCFEKLKEFQKQRLVDQYICGVCVGACSGKI